MMTYKTLILPIQSYFSHCVSVAPARHTCQATCTWLHSSCSAMIQVWSWMSMIHLLKTAVWKIQTRYVAVLGPADQTNSPSKAVATTSSKTYNQSQCQPATRVVPQPRRRPSRFLSRAKVNANRSTVRLRQWSRTMLNARKRPLPK